MSAAEYNSWKQYFEVEPWGSHYDDLRAGIVTAAIYNVNRDPEKNPDGFGPLECVPWNRYSEREEIVELEDPSEHSKLLTRSLFNL